MKRRLGLSSAALAVIVSAGASTAQAADKSPFSLFYPTPDHLLRDLTTDRPDTTESPFTVDAGRVQVETNLFGYARSRPDGEGTVTETYEVAVTNVRIGLTSSVEAGFLWQPHGVVRVRQADPASVFRHSGIGGLELRAKFNIWGNDAFDKPGATALALLPFVVLPTDRHNGVSPDFVEGGLIVPYAIKLSEKFGLGLNAGLAYLKEEPTAGYHAEYLASASLSYEWSENLGTYYEVAARFNIDDARGDAVVLGTGFTYKLGKNIQLDGGVNFGLTRAADRINPFVGLSTRF